MNSLATHYHQMIGLNEDWTIESVELDLEAQTLALALEFIGAKVICPECQTACSRKDKLPQRSWRHLDAMQFSTHLTARVPRCSCDTCGVKTIEVPWAGKHGRFTLMFEAFAIEILQAARSVDAASKVLKIDWSVAQKIMQDAVERGLERRSVEEVEHLGVDEKSFRKGHDYVTILTDQDASRVLDVAPERTIEACDQVLNCLPELQKEQIKAVSMDMWQGFETSVEKNLKNAEIVHDRFHITKYLKEAVDQVRRAENKQLADQGDDSLKGTKHLMLFNPENLTAAKQEELSKILKSVKKTSKAWHLVEWFRFFWEEEDSQGGREFFQRWYASAIRSRLAPIKKVARMLKKRLDRIVTWFTHRISNGRAEGFNSRIQSIKSAARGFRIFKHYRTRILFFCGKLNLKPAIN